MPEWDKISAFFAAIVDDPRVNTTHVSLYFALLHYWEEHAFLSPIRVFSHDIMPLAKILSTATYHRSIRALSDFGYIRYEPSFKRNQGSKVYILLK